MTHVAGTPVVKARASIWLGQLRLGGKAPILRDARPLAAAPIGGPLLGQIQLTVQQDMAQRTGIAQKHGDLAMVHLTRCPAVLAGDASRVVTFFQKAGFVEHQYRPESPTCWTT